MGQFDAKAFADALSQHGVLAVAHEDRSKAHPIAISDSNAAAGSAREREAVKRCHHC
jgi:hypothetical protein